MALAKIEEFLQADDIEGQFSDRSGNYYSNDKFIVSWLSNYKGRIASEESIDVTDTLYFAISGAKCIHASRSLFHEKQLSSYASFERAFCDVGLMLCPKDYRKEFFDKYVTAYNNRLVEAGKVNRVKQ